MQIILLMQPPTPTLIPTYPPADLPIQLPDIPGVWDFAPEAIGWWNRIPPFVTVSFQALALLVIIFIGYRLLLSFIRRWSSESQSVTVED
jgi:hypothetical protein